MSWSLQLRNGDLALGGAQLGQVTGGAKLVQDLRCAILESRGMDDMHPLFGSLIDGGLDDYGVEQPSIIGTSDWDRIALRVDAEVRRICSEYQRQQLARAREDRYTYGESTLRSDELLLQVNSIQMVQAQDQLMVTVSITTGNGTEKTLDIPVSGEGVL